MVVSVSVAKADITRRVMLRSPGRADAQVYQLLRTPPASGVAPMFVRAADADAQRTLRALGVPVTVGSWTAVNLDTAGLTAALASAGQLEIAVQPPLRTYLEMSAREIGVTDVQAGFGVQSPRTGRGVLVGIIDTGVDLTHPAFLDDDGRSRVIAFWDQDATGAHPDGFDYGAECREAAIAAGSCTLHDPNGHGTHVTGIAAGNGQLGGIAPHAKIAVVRSDAFTRIADAVQYLTHLAHDRGMPLVINLSVGGQYGAHDGGTPLEQWLDDHLGDGRILVAAAGNDGASRLHARTALRTTEQRLAIERVPLGRSVTATVDIWTENDTVLAAELWVDGASVGRLALDTNDGEVLRHSIAQPNDYEVVFTFTSEQRGGRRHASLVVDGSAAASIDGRAQVVLVMAGSSIADAWVGQSDGGSSARFAVSSGDGWVGGDGRESIAVPASAKSVIAVGAYSTRNSWVSELDGVQHIDTLPLGRLAPYSSIGPTAAPDRTGIKPDIAAPGSVIISARARNVPDSPDVVDAERVIMQGTSMAAPHVSGVAALMLEAAPKLSPKDLRRIFARTARADIETGSLPNEAFGLGKIDARAAVAMAESEPQGCAAVSADAVSVLAFAVLLTFWRRRRASKQP